MSRASAKIRRVRCAIYTRKSTEEGLDQSFNSLHAQREACEAYIRSQAGEGWIALERAYDDGGFSGGNMERPGLGRLLDDVAASKVDVIVVYKVDRLTRSLTDFAKIVERFDEKGVSFVSVTQAFNTTTSMGRLTLNVLLSFAQFEREVTGERIRDKIAASKAKGMWMGGNLPLGYDAPTDPVTRSLVVNRTEAEDVRQIFRQYLELGSIRALREWLELAGIRPKVSLARRGRSRGDAVFSRGALLHLLKNRTYLGEIPHKGVSHPAAHPPIVDGDVFEAVQAKLAGAAVRRAQTRKPSTNAPLRGKIFDATGGPMSPSVSRGKSGRLYRYYVSGRALRGEQGAAGELQRISGPLIDAIVAERLGGLADDPDRLLRVYVSHGEVTLHLDPQLSPSELDALASRLGPSDAVERDADAVVVRIRATMRVRGGRTWAVAADGRQALRRAVVDRTLVRALGRAHNLVRSVSPPRLDRSLEAMTPPSPLTTYERRLCQAALLAPQLQHAILEGTQPVGLTLERLINEDLPLAWVDQIAAFRG